MDQKVVISLKRLVPGLILGPACWLGSSTVITSLFLPAMLQHIDAAHKVAALAMFSTCGMIVAAISNMIAGELSDQTYSRFGKRAPWIVGGGAAFMLAMVCASFAHSIPYLLIAYMLGQAALNFIVAPMVAWLDFAPDNGQATASAAYGGLGMALGNNAFNVVGALLLGQFRLGFIIFGIVAFVGSLVAVLIVHEPSNRDDAKRGQKKAKKAVNFNLLNFAKAFPRWSVGRDYYLALIGKIFQGVGNFAITGYILYIMTDFLHRGSQTQSSIQLVNSIMLTFGIILGLVAGPIADHFKILKYPVSLSTIFLALGALSMFTMRNTIGITIYAVFAGLGMGTWNALDNLLNLKLIPDKNRVAFFLGVYNLGNTVTQAIAPIIAATVISIWGYSAIFVVSFLFALIGGFCMFSVKGVKY